jgi:hypothetical protein
MSPTISNAQTTTEQPSLLRVPATRYTPENHHKFLNEPSLGFAWDQEDFDGPDGTSSSVRFVSIVSNTDIGNRPEVEAAIKETGKQVVKADVDGDLAAEWKKVEAATNERFRRMSGKIMHIAQTSDLGPFREWKFDNGTDHMNLLREPSVNMWTTQPRPDGQHSKSRTSGTKSALRLPSGAVVPRRKHYVQNDSDDPSDTTQSGAQSSRGRKTIRDGE